MKSNNPCTSVHSCGLADMVSTATGRPRASTKNHYFHAFSDARAADAVAAAARLAKRAVDKALVQFVLAAFFDKPTGIAHDCFEDTVFDPGFEPAMHRTLRTKLGGQVLPLRAVVEHPENTAHHFALVHGGRPPNGLRGGSGIRAKSQSRCSSLSCNISIRLTVQKIGFGIASNQITSLERIWSSSVTV